ncbi:MAG: Fe-S cluster assembly protein SufD [Acidobacteria bacterium]|nr:Fe-S cluster assembly protein SufD [Acidobacteriota bacterium]
MSTATLDERQAPYLAELDRFLRGRGDAAPARVRTLREQGLARFQSMGFPSTRDEAWRFTNVQALTSTPFRLGDGVPTNPMPLVQRVALPGAVRLVLLNGRFAPELSDLSAVPTGLKVGSLATALAQGAPECSHLGEAPMDAHPFAALNTAFLEDGALIAIRKGAVIDTPIHIVVITGGTGKTMVHPRVLLVAGEASQATVSLTLLTSAGEAHYTNLVTEAVIGEQAHIECVLDQRGTEGAFLTSNLHVSVARQGTFRLRTVTLGGRIVRNDASALLAGEGAHVDFDGVYLVDGSGLVDNHTTIDHATPHCTSHELYKGILDGKARAVFNGRIIVRLDAQKTDAKQTNRALLLSNDATINSNPQLEIFADDVKCTHGAAVGQLDDEALFYLRARGLTEQAARDLLIHAYAGEVLGRISVPGLRQQLERELFRQLERDLAEHTQAGAVPAAGATVDQE